MILLITPSLLGEQSARAIEALAREKVQLAASLKSGLAHLRSREFSVVIFDDGLLEFNRTEGDLLIRRVGTAMPVYVNLGISGTDRVVQQVKAALHRRQEERSLAFRAAEAHLRSELRGDLTALLLTSGMALSEPLPAAAEAKVRSIQEAAARMKARLQLR